MICTARSSGVFLNEGIAYSTGRSTTLAQWLCRVVDQTAEFP